VFAPQRTTASSSSLNVRIHRFRGLSSHGLFTASHSLCRGQLRASLVSMRNDLSVMAKKH
jgi:hypothetical protein